MRLEQPAMCSETQQLTARYRAALAMACLATLAMAGLPGRDLWAYPSAAQADPGVMTQAQPGLAEQLAAGDKAVQARNAAEALTHFEKALQIDARNYDALCKASGAAIDLGEAEKNEARREAFYLQANTLAARAIAVNPDGAEGQFAMARAIGRRALTMGSRDRVKFAKEVREHALKALAADPTHAGALHVMGVWNAEIMRLSSFVRLVAKTVLGGQIFGEASWAAATSYLEKSVAADPVRAVHHLDLARVYRDTDRKADARAQYEAAIKAPLTDANDVMFQQQAADELRALK